MQVLIENKAFHLKFGMKCLMLLGKELGFKSYSEVVNHLAILDKVTEDLTFEQADLIESLIKAAAATHPDYKQLDYTIDNADILSWVFSNPQEFSQAIKLLVDSLPQQQHAGKKPPGGTGKKTSAKK